MVAEDRTKLGSSTDFFLILLEVRGSEFSAILRYIKTLRPALDTKLKKEGDFSIWGCYHFIKPVDEQRVDGWIDGWMVERRMDRWMDRWING